MMTAPNSVCMSIRVIDRGAGHSRPFKACVRAYLAVCHDSPIETLHYIIHDAPHGCLVNVSLRGILAQHLSIKQGSTCKVMLLLRYMASLGNRQPRQQFECWDFKSSVTAA